MGQARSFQDRINMQNLSARIDQLRGEERLFSAAVDIGGLFDTHPGAISGTGGDVGLLLEAGLGYRLPLDGKFGFRMDYSGHADFHQEFDEYDLQEHQVAVEAQLAFDKIVWSLQLGGGRIFENGRHDADSIIVSPAVTRLLGSGSKAIALYAHAAKIEDKDTSSVLNEDRKTFGGGVSYFFTSGETGSGLISVVYTGTDFEASIEDYDPTVQSNDKRNDQAITASIDLLTRVAAHMGFYATYSYSDNRSNITVFDYKRHTLEAGISVSY